MLLPKIIKDVKRFKYLFPSEQGGTQRKLTFSLRTSISTLYATYKRYKRF